MDRDWETKEQAWQKNYQLLKDFIEKNGHAKVPDDEPTLGTWVSKQRQVKKEGNLSEERIRLLDEIGFIWDPKQQAWQNNYQLLKDFIEKNCHAKVPSSNPTIGNWVGNTRQAKIKGKLSEEQIRLLDEVGFIWKASRD